MKYFIIIVVVIILAACGFETVSVDDSADRKQELVFVEHRALLPAVVHLPADYERRKEYPLIIGLHGHGGTVGQLLRFAPLFAGAGMIFAVPKAPYVFPVRGGIGGDWLTHIEDSPLKRRNLDLTVAYIVKVLEDLKARYRVGHAYLLGFSEGGALTYVIGARHHGLFSALIVFGAPFDSKWFPGVQLPFASHLPVLIAHGQNDKTALAYARRAMEELSGHGYGLTYITYPGDHHLTAGGVKLAVEWIQRNNHFARIRFDLPSILPGRPRESQKNSELL